MPEKKEKKAKKGWRIFRSWMFGGSHSTVFDLFADGDVVKAEEMMFKTTRIFHIIAFAFVPIAVSVVISIMILHKNSNTDINGESVLISYICSFIFLIVGVVWRRVFSWRIWLQGSFFGVFMNHIVRLGCFFTILLAASISGLNSFTTFYSVIPLIIIYTGIIIYTFPTKKKWCKWSDYTSLLCD